MCVVFALIFFAFAGTTAQAAPRDLNFATSDGNRLAIVAPAGPGPRPTVIVIQGETASGGVTIATSGFARQAARRGFNAVYPESFGRKFNDLRHGGTMRTNDIAMLRALVAVLIEEQIAQPGKIYLVGISSGGMMALTAACRMSGEFAGIAVIGGGLVQGAAPCDAKPVPLVMIAGTADPMVPYRGGDLGLWGSPGSVLGIEATARLFAERGGCAVETSSPLTDADKRDGSSVTRMVWSGCAAPVTLYRVDGGGHQIPGTAPFMSDMLGATNQDFLAAEAIMELFARLP